MLYKISLLFIILFIVTSVHAQENKPAPVVGIIKGIVFDSAHNYSLPSATIAVYKNNTTALINYQLSNNFGEFTLNALPLSVPLNLIITYVGYRSFNKEVTIPVNAGNVLDLKKLNLVPLESQLEAVTITALPPVVVKGDTLVFNADAFQLDKNAVVEDLLRKLPGITLWGDGTITLNGKPVKSVLVDGKPFFDGNAQIATQNIPKDAVDKIQVYRKNVMEGSADSTMEVNIMLKENARNGYYGKATAGLGTRNSYEFDGVLNKFSPKTQLQIVGGGNNVNKDKNSIEAAVRNASFKGIGASTEFNPDFSKPGTNKHYSGGFSYQHDFPVLVKSAINQLKAAYFTNQNQRDINRNSQTQIALNDNNQQLISDTSARNITALSHTLNTQYRHKNDNKTYYINSSAYLNKDYGNYNLRTMVSNNILGIQSDNNSIQRTDNNSKNLFVETGFNYSPDLNRIEKNRLARMSYNIGYTFSFDEGNNTRDNLTNVQSFIDSTYNKYNRNYNNQAEDFNHKLILKADHFSKFLNIQKLNTWGIDLGLDNILIVHHSNTNDLVEDLNSSSNAVINQYLTTASRYQIFNETPALRIRKDFDKLLYGRYQNTLSFKVDLREQIYIQKNSSQKDFQNFKRSYYSFIPAAGISYRNNVHSSHETIYTLDYATSNQYPTVNQLAPLVDSLNTWLNIGNINLKPSYKNDLSAGISHFSSKNNTFNFGLNGSIGKITNAIADSIISNQKGKIIRYYFNSAYSKYSSFNGRLSKFYKFKDQTLEFNFSTRFNLNAYSNYVDTILNSSRRKTSYTSISVLYSFKNLFSVKLIQNLNYYSFNRENLTNKNKDYSTAASGSVTIDKKFSVNSNISYKTNISSLGKPINYTIWNVGISQRFLEKDNIELKFSILDILRQNINVINSNTADGINRTTVNALQQYYMVTLSYFPRNFGEGKSNSK